MNTPAGEPVYQSKPDGVFARRRRRPQKTIGRRFVLARGNRWYFAEWSPWKGLLISGSAKPGASAPTVNYPVPEETVAMMKRRAVLTPGGVILPQLSEVSSIFEAFPLICAHQSRTQYEDGTPRKPGYVWWSNRGSHYEVIAFDYDSGGRLPVTAITIDDAWMALEVALAAPEAPWVPDNYLMKLLTQNSKKKGS